jgi:CRP/FNR family transcriptional regulator
MFDGMDNTANNISCRNCNSASVCFKKLLPDELDYLDKHKSRVVFSKGETICKEGNFSSGVKFITDGLVKVYIEGPNKRKIIVKLVNRGDFLGLSSLYGNTTYSYSATALRDTDACMIAREAILDLILKSGDFGHEIVKWYCESYRLAYKKLESIGFKNLPGRVSDVLLYLDQPKFREEDVFKYLTRSDLAEMAGIPMESCVRVLSEFNESNIIQTRGKEIRLLNTDMLKRISRAG